MDALVPIRAAGGVVWRRGAGLGGHTGADREIVLVHRPRRDDWTLPKGKLEPGEIPVVAAVREVWEETAIRALVGARLPTVNYEVWAKPANGGEPALVGKSVEYWAMRVALADDFTPGRETDVRAWFSPAQARAQLSYPHDLKVLTAFAELPLLRDPLIVLRHASAGHRGEFEGADGARPLDSAGMARAAELVAALRCFGPAQLVSASPVRCAQTLWPLARSLDLPVETDHCLDDEADPRVAAQRLRGLTDGGRCVVVCSQGKLIPRALAVLSGRPMEEFRVAKGAGWVLSFNDKGLVTVDDLPG